MHVYTHTYRCKRTESDNILQPKDTYTRLLHGSGRAGYGWERSLAQGGGSEEDNAMATVTMEVRNAT